MRGKFTARERVELMFFFSSRRRHTRFDCDWSSDVCSSDLEVVVINRGKRHGLEPGNVLAVDQAGDVVRDLYGGGRKIGRSEERRVGEECRSRWSPDH